jgi:hypothetical protein
MKFYRKTDKSPILNPLDNGTKIEQYISYNKIFVLFYKENDLHNTKNAAIFAEDGKKGFYLYDEIFYKNFQPKEEYDIDPSDVDVTINKHFWRRFVKMQIFL